MMSKQITGYIQVKHLQNVSDVQENLTLRNEFRSVYLMNYECPEKEAGLCWVVLQSLQETCN